MASERLERFKVWKRYLDGEVVSFVLPKRDLERLYECMERLGMTNRSEVLRMAVKKWLDEHCPREG